MVELIFSKLALQLLFTVGVIVCAGVLLALAKRFFLRSCGSAAYRVQIVTGVVGTPVHELSHALFCLIFGHRITEMKLFTPNADDGSLGHVSHSYRKKNLWHQLGNFFIGIAPILGGTAMLLLLLRLLLPATFSGVTGALAYGGSSIFGGSGGFSLEALLLTVKEMLKALFLPSNFLSWEWYVYMILAVFILMHMEISPSDIRSGLLGFLYFALIFLVADAVLAYVFPGALFAFTAGVISAGAYLLSFLSLSVLLSLLMALISLPVRLIRR